MTLWAKQTIEDLVKSCEVECDGGKLTAQKITWEEGDAEIVHVRGKRKNIFNFIFEVTVVATLGEDTGSCILKYVDVNGDSNGEYEVETSIKDKSKLSGPVLAAIKDNACEEMVGMQGEINGKLDEFMEIMLQQ
jgi:hypothetical protein